MLSLPFLEKMASSQRILIAGCGGGFDVYCGVPFFRGMIAAGKNVVAANLSFTALTRCGGEQIAEALWRVDRQADELPYFPESWLCEWLRRQNMEIPVYGLARTGVAPLVAAYEAIIHLHDIDLVVLVDGGTDSLLFGDEPGLGTVTEDAVSIVAANAATKGASILLTLGFGIDHHHGVSHHAFLENAARMTRRGDWLGNVSLTSGTPESADFLDLIDYANRRQPQHPSIVCNSIASALRGEFGDFHSTHRTGGSELFINPLMAEYWGFSTAGVVDAMLYASALLASQTIEEATTIIESCRETLAIRERKSLPL